MRRCSAAVHGLRAPHGARRRAGAHAPPSPPQLGREDGRVARHRRAPRLGDLLHVGDVRYLVGDEEDGRDERPGGRVADRDGGDEPVRARHGAGRASARARRAPSASASGGQHERERRPRDPRTAPAAVPAADPRHHRSPRAPTTTRSRAGTSRSAARRRPACRRSVSAPVPGAARSPIAPDRAGSRARTRHAHVDARESRAARAIGATSAIPRQPAATGHAVEHARAVPDGDDARPARSASPGVSCACRLAVPAGSVAPRWQSVLPPAAVATTALGCAPLLPERRGCAARERGGDRRPRARRRRSPACCDVALRARQRSPSSLPRRPHPPVADRSVGQRTASRCAGTALRQRVPDVVADDRGEQRRVEAVERAAVGAEQRRRSPSCRRRA